MKRILCVLCAAMLLFVGCHSKPSGMSGEDYEKAKRCVEIADDVLKGNIDAEKAGRSLGTMRYGFEDGTLETYVLLLSISVDNYADGFESSSDVKKKRDKLAELINY